MTFDTRNGINSINEEISFSSDPSESSHILEDVESDCTSSFHLETEEDDEMEIEFFKVLVVGMAKSGKTSFIRRLVHNVFDDEYKTTIGADYFEKSIKINENSMACVQIWDIAGQDRFAKLTRRYFSNADGAIILCDITSEYTIHGVMDWKNELDAWCGFDNQIHLPVILVANKCDLLADIATALESGITMQKMVTETRINEWFRTSAKSGEKVNEAVEKLVSIMMHRREMMKETGDTNEGNYLDTSDIIRLDESIFTRSHGNNQDSCNCN